MHELRCRNRMFIRNSRRLVLARYHPASPLESVTLRPCDKQIVERDPDRSLVARDFYIAMGSRGLEPRDVSGSVAEHGPEIGSNNGLGSI